MDEKEVERLIALGKERERRRPIKRVLVQVPNPETVGQEAYRKFLREYVDHVRKLAGVPPLYSDEEKKLSDQD